MDPIELVDSWDDLDRDERADALGEIVNDTLEDWGYDPVETDVDALDGANAHYDDGEVVFDGEYLETDNPYEAIETAFHEAAHAMNDQDGDYELLTDEENETYNDRVSIDLSYDENGEIVAENVLNEFHEDVKDFAEWMLEEWFGPGAADAKPVGGGVAESGTGAADAVFEIDMSGVVVSP